MNPNFSGLQKNFSLSSTTSFRSTKTKSLKQINIDKRVNRQFQSVKKLKVFHQRYEKYLPNQNTKNTIQQIKSTFVQKVHDAQLQKAKTSLVKNTIIKQKIKSLIQKVYVDLLIFKKVQSAVKRKKSIISRLFGWDQIFTDVYFQGQEIKPFITQENVQNVIFNVKSNRSDDQLKSLYNKLRFFHQELKEFNYKQQNIQINQKGRYLKENIQKMTIKLKTLQSPEKPKSSIAFQIRQYSPVKVKKSLRTILEINNGNNIGNLGISDFELRWGQDIDHLQSIVQTGYRSCNIQK